MAEGQNRDLVLAPNEFAYILDETKGHINCYVGPNKMSLANTDRPVVFDPKSRRYNRMELDRAISQFPFAAEGEYIVLENPADAGAGDQGHPKTGTSNVQIKLLDGNRHNIPGPTTFPLWPGQTVQVIPGHILRLNQYLVVRVYNEETAKSNWDSAVVKARGTQSPDDSGGGQGGKDDKDTKDNKSPSASSSTDKKSKARTSIDPSQLVTGQLLIIKGTEVSFYIPPTGIEVIPDENGKYVRDAVTLETMEYCMLLDENGNKRYVRGPAVVFPNPTEQFVQEGKNVKFRAIQLPENAGLYIQVISDYEDGDQKYVAGQELFIVGKECAIYFPRPEHAIVKYGDQIVHYAVAIPEGEGRYVLDKNSGEIKLVRGPKMFLADPRKEVLVKRILPSSVVELLYPGNTEALAYNRQLSTTAPVGGGLEYDDSDIDLPTASIGSAMYMAESARGSISTVSNMAKALAAQPAHDAAKVLAGDRVNRSTQFTKPRTITIDSKYEGAVTVKVWSGYAILVIDNTGKQRVVMGPQTALLEYDESVMVLELSTGKPKTTDQLLRTAYLQVRNNKIGDIVSATTSDMVNVDIKVSYRVNFLEKAPSGGAIKPESWFSVENYVKFLCDHARSRLRNRIQRITIEELYASSGDIVRDMILGERKEAGVDRDGLFFPENGMHVYDVEVLGFEIGDDEISGMLEAAQTETIRRNLSVRRAEAELDSIVRLEETSRLTHDEKVKTELSKLRNEAARQEEQAKISLARIQHEASVKSAELDAELAEHQKALEVGEVHRQCETSTAEMVAAVERIRSSVKIETLAKESKLKTDQEQAITEELVKRASAFSPALINAIQTLGDQSTVEKLAGAMSPLAILGGQSVTDVASRLLKGTKFENTIKSLAGHSDNLVPAGSDK